MLIAACGSSDDTASTDNSNTDTSNTDTSNTDNSGAAAERPTVVVTTNILGDVVRQSVGDLVDVEVIMPVGSDPHDFAPSARQAETMEEADLLVINGAGFEEGMSDIILNVEDSGTPTFAAADHVELIILGDDDEHGDDEHSDDEHSDEDHDEDHDEHSDEDHDEHGDDEHSDEDHDEDKDHDEHGDEDHDDDKDHDEHGDEDHDGDDHHDHSSGVDPHLWTDPDRITDVVIALGSAVAELDGVDDDQLATSVDAYVAELGELAEDMESKLGTVPTERRVLVTNHEVFGYFAERFGFEVIGTVIPSLSTGAEPSAAALEQLAELIETEEIPAVFGETTASSRLAEVLADEVDGDLAGQVIVVELFSESLGDAESGAETYIDMMTTNASRIADALNSN